MIDAVVHALSVAFGMTWEILWPLILGFTLSGIVQAVVSKREMTKLLPDDSPRTLAVAAGLGAASSSCSYAAVALARSLFRRGADFTAAMAFEFASTNLVIELGILLAVLIAWQFTAAEFVGGIVMIVILALIFRRALSPSLVEEARANADRGRRRTDGGPRGDGHEHRGRVARLAPAVGSRLHGDEPLLRDGLGIDLDGYRDRPPGRGRARRVGPGVVLAGVLLRRSPAGRETLGAAGRAAGRDALVRLLDRERPAGGRALERRDQLRRRDRRSSSPI